MNFFFSRRFLLYFTSTQWSTFEFSALEQQRNFVRRIHFDNFENLLPLQIVNHRNCAFKLILYKIGNKFLFSSTLCFFSSSSNTTKERIKYLLEPTRSTATDQLSQQVFFFAEQQSLNKIEKNLNRSSHVMQWSKRVKSWDCCEHFGYSMWLWSAELGFIFSLTASWFVKLIAERCWANYSSIIGIEGSNRVINY